MSLPKINSATRTSLFVFIFISITFVFVKIRQVVSDDKFIPQSYALSWDNYGYYLHLPATIIHHDVGIEDKSWLDELNSKYQAGRPFYQVAFGQKNRFVNVYPVGLAVGNLPFFLIGHACAKIFGYSADGLSPPYQWAIIFSSLFYGILGMWWLRKLLWNYFTDRITALLLILIGLGTNLYCYATYDNTLPHIFLFAIDTQLILLTLSWHDRPKKSTALFIGMLIGLATITRPSEIVWLLVPLFWNVAGWQSLKEKIKLLGKHFVDVFLLIFGMVAVGSLQLFYWKYTSGNWFSFNHTEGFDFFRPFTWQVLFSYKKGWLLYTPLLLFAIPGIFLLYKKQRSIFYAVLIFFLANLWFISSWECWWYGGSFGQRSFVQSYGLLAIPLGVFATMVLRNGKKIVHVSFLTLVGFFLLLNQFQTWQIKMGIIDPTLMSEKYYWKIFGKTSVDPKWRSLLEIDRGNLPDSIDMNRYNKLSSVNLDCENPAQSFPKEMLCDSVTHNSKFSLRLDSINPFGANFKKTFCEISRKDHLRFRLTTDIFITKSLESKPIYLVFTMVGSRGQSYGYTSFPIDSSMLQPNEWRTVTANFVTPYILHNDDVVNVNVWNYNGEEIFIDNPVLEIFEPK